MATKEELYRIGQAGFEAIDRFFGSRCVVPSPEEKRYLYHRHEVPLETIPSPYLVYQRTEVSHVPEWLFAPPPPAGPPHNFQFSRPFPVKQQNPPKIMGERREFLPLGPYQVQYPPQDLYRNRPAGWVPTAEAVAIANIKVAQLYAGITRIDYGRLK
ncbi:hypothetical protein CDL15_Pgr016717 [Punica granatum]|uniref:Uncharacterized protein n=1 Tax=Punica granatum TaxID=22663 RepID=A0A218XT79_PUNGR|nr:hypothetical protein CDL15_Pgr016717 [Punica granatum]PKI56737.1 hypothetical protein CRG98_022897 [Punica granatum]